jgi:hypothetical protein
MGRPELRVHATYSNGAYGARWSVRQVLEIARCADNPDAECVTYKVVAGLHRRACHTVSRSDFLRWMKYEVVCHETHWLRVGSKESGP